MWFFSPSTQLFIGYKTSPWSLSSENLRTKPSQANQSILCSHLNDDGEVHTWLAIINLNESPQSPEKLEFNFLFFVVFCIFLKRQKNHNSCLYILMRFVNRLSRQNRISQQKHVSFLNMCNEKLEKSWFSVLLVKVDLWTTTSKFQVKEKIWHTCTKMLMLAFLRRPR